MGATLAAAVPSVCAMICSSSILNDAPHPLVGSCDGNAAPAPPKPRKSTASSMSSGSADGGYRTIPSLTLPFSEPRKKLGAPSPVSYAAGSARAPRPAPLARGARDGAESKLPGAGRELATTGAGAEATDKENDYAMHGGLQAYI
eukprot:COSAG02_NODE_19983_length_854_cov_0.945695_2_plen_145_part_00